VAYSVSGAILFMVATCLERTVGPERLPNVLLTVVLLLITLWLAWRRGFSPLEMLSEKADRSLVTALRRRFPLTNPV